MIIPKFPNPAEIALAIERTEAILANKKINTYKNKPLKEGYTYCIQLLRNRLINPENPFFVADKEEELETAENVYREQMLPIKKLKTEIGRTIAVLCNDFLNGQDYEQMFLDEAFMKGNKDKVLKRVIARYKERQEVAVDEIKDLLSNDGQRYTAVMDNQFKMAGTIRVVDGQVFLEQNKEHGKGQEDEVEKKYFCSVGDGSQAILDFMGISNFKVLSE
jgi:hypothetical protein